MDGKKLILTLLAIVSIQFTTQAQTSFSCSYREYCPWNVDLETFDNCEGYEESSLFVLNELETMVTHTTETLTSTYYLRNGESNSEHNVVTFDATSDVGNEYYFVFDIVNEEIRFMYTRDDELTLLRFTVKAIF